MNSLPPKFWTSVFRRFCADDYLEELEGDLEERFLENTLLYGQAKARRLYRAEVLKMLRPSVWTSRSHAHATSRFHFALRSHFKVLLRNLRRQWAFSLINILGLALSMATGILVLTMLFELKQFDDFHEAPEDIFRVITYRNINGNITPLAVSPAVLSGTMADELPQVKSATRVKVFHKTINRHKYELAIKGLYADATFFDVFNFDLVRGNVQGLQEPGSMYITEELASKLFQNGNPVGEHLSIAGEGEFLIRGILKDLPKNTHLQFEALIASGNFQTAADVQPWRDISSVITYIRKEPASHTRNIENWLNTRADQQYKTENIKARFELQPIQKAISGQQLSHQPGTVIPSIVIYILTGAALAILMAGCFNYTNLSIARALSRMKEVGVRKTAGSSRFQIFLHYLSETVLLAVMGFGLALLIFLLIRPHFLKVFWMMESLFDLQLTVPMVLRSFVFSVVVGLLAGLYPALIYSRINTVSALKGKATVKLTLKKHLRNGLIVIQFSLVFAFILVSYVSEKQYHYIDQRDKGFAPSGLISLPLKGNSPELLASAFEAIPGVEQVNFTSAVFGGSVNKSRVIDPEKRDSLNIHHISSSDNLLSTYRIELLAGGTLAEGGKNSALINKRLANYLTQGHPVKAIGKELVIDGNRVFVTGITKDFSFGALQDRIAPLIVSQTGPPDYATIRYNNAFDVNFYEKLEEAWQSVDSQNIPEPLTVEARYAGSIQFLKETVRATGYLGICLITIAGLGLLAIIGFQIQLRIKDLSLRRVLGARPVQLLQNISKSFIGLLALAAIMGSSAAYLLLDTSLIATFYYRIDIGPGEILPPVMLVFLISGGFVLAQVLKVVRINPAKNLKQE